MAITTKIMTAAEVKSEVAIANSFDNAAFDNYILEAQRQYIKPFLGEDFYNTILDQVESTATQTAENTNLLTNFLKPTLARFVLFETLPELRNQLTSKGLFVNQSEFSEAATDKGYADFRNAILKSAERYKEHMKDWMRDEIDDGNATYSQWDQGDSHQNKYGFITY